MTAIEFTHQVAGMRSTLHRLTSRFTHDRDEALDLVQDTILKALTYRDKFREDTNLKGWLFTIMRNTFINGYRRRKRTRTAKDSSNDLFCLSVEELHTFNRPAERMEFKELLGSVDSVKEELRLPFTLHASGYKYHEIAKRLNIPIGTVKNRIFHARKAIQKNLQGY